MTYLRAALHVWRHTWSKALRRPVLLSFSLVQPLLWIIFFGFLFQRYAILEGPPGIRYLDFLLPGICCMTVLFGGSQSGVGIIRDLQTGFLQRMFEAATPPYIILVSKIFSDVSRLMVQALIVIGLGLVLGVRYNLNATGICLGIISLGLFAFSYCSLSCLVALKAKNQETMAMFIHIVNMPLLFTSSIFVPEKQMPTWLEAVASYNPLSTVSQSLREGLIYDSSSSLNDLWPLIIIAATAGLLIKKVRLKSNRKFKRTHRS